MTAASSNVPSPISAATGVIGWGADADDVIGLLRVARRNQAELDRDKLLLVGRAVRAGTFGALGVGVVQGVADVLGVDRVEGMHLVQAAEMLCERVSLLGETLPARLPVLAEAVHGGAVDLARARAALGPLTSAAAERIGAGARCEAEVTIVAYARDNDPCPARLRRYARGVVAELDQDGPEPRERRQRREPWLYRDPDGAGGTVRAALDAAGFAAVETALDALSTPGADDHRGLPHRRADALVELAEFSLAHNADLPAGGGERPQVQVVMRLEDLQRQAAGSLLDQRGDLLTSAQLRRVLCDCAVVPHVLGGDGQPLDIARATRVVPAAIRRAVLVRDRGCAFPGCERKPGRCECHHIIPWSHGGCTAVDNLALLCLFHHKLMHNSDWRMRIRDGTPEFIPPRWVDPSQVPRREPKH